MNFGTGQRVKAVRTIQRNTGAAWSGDIGKIVKVTGDGYVVRWDHNGGFETDLVKDGDVERA